MNVGMRDRIAHALACAPAASILTKRELEDLADNVMIVLDDEYEKKPKPKESNHG